MTPKQKYDERKRLRAERLSREEHDPDYRFRSSDKAELVMERMVNSFERIADAVELWADMQEQPKGP